MSLNTYMGAGPVAQQRGNVAHTGQVVRVKVNAKTTCFLECDAADTPTAVIQQMVDAGQCKPQKYADVFDGTIPRKYQDAFLARLQRGPMPLLETKPISEQQVGPDEILCYVEVNKDVIADQGWAEVDEAIRTQPFYIELERQMEEERLRRVAAEEERQRRAEAERKRKEEEEEAKAKKKGGKKKKK